MSKRVVRRKGQWLSTIETIQAKVWSASWSSSGKILKCNHLRTREMVPKERVKIIHPTIFPFFVLFPTNQNPITVPFLWASSPSTIPASTGPTVTIVTYPSPETSMCRDPLSTIEDSLYFPFGDFLRASACVVGGEQRLSASEKETMCESEKRSKNSGQRRVRLLYDKSMCNHHTPDDDLQIALGHYRPVYNFVRLANLYYAGSHGIDIKGPTRSSKYNKDRKVEGVLYQHTSDFLPMIDEVYRQLVDKTSNS